MIERLNALFSRPLPGPFGPGGSRDRIRLPDLLPRARQCPNSYQSVRCYLEGEHPSDSIDSAMSCLPHRSDRLGAPSAVMAVKPTEHLVSDARRRVEAQAGLASGAPTQA